MQQVGLSSSSGLGVALAGTQITGLDLYHNFWNTRLWASHVLAQGAGASDVVGDMWKLSWVYPAQPSLVPAGRESRHQNTETCIQTDKHGNLVCYVHTLTLRLKCKLICHCIGKLKKKLLPYLHETLHLHRLAALLTSWEGGRPKSQSSSQKSKGCQNWHQRFPRFFRLKPANRARLIWP